VLSRPVSEMPTKRRHGLVSGLSFSSLGRALWTPDAELTPEESASTLFRFFRSKHVLDLKLIVALTLLSLIILFFCVLVTAVLDAWPEEAPGGLVKFFEFIAKYCGPAVAVGASLLGGPTDLRPQGSVSSIYLRVRSAPFVASAPCST
jgi:hypothetical protein